MYPQTHQSPGVCDDDSSVIFDIVRVLISNMQHCVFKRSEEEHTAGWAAL